MIIIIVLKLDLGVDLGQGLGYRSGGSTQVNPSQHVDKNCYCHSFKTQLEG